MDKYIDRQIDKWINIYIDRWINIQIDRLIEGARVDVKASLSIKALTNLLRSRMQTPGSTFSSIL